MSARLQSLVAAAALLLAAVPAVAEVSVNGNGSTVFFQSAPGRTWSQFRGGVPAAHLLNPFGDERGDGAPSIGVNPYTQAPEVAWGRAGRQPALVFASWDEGALAWNVRDVAPARNATPWAGRVVTLVHDDHGNRFVTLDDPDTGSILLASAPPLSQHVNRPIRVNPPGVPGARPAVIWDGRALVIAYERLDLAGGIGVVELVPVTDDQGFIPNGGEGVPGIPEPVYGYLGGGIAGFSAGASGTVPASGLGSATTVAPLPVPGLAPDTAEEMLALVRIEAVAGERLLVTWIEKDVLDYVVREADGSWSEVASVPLPEPVDHESARADVRRLIGATGGPRRR